MDVTQDQGRENSTHKVEVVPVRLEKHPNADKLSVVKVFGYVVCTGTDGWTCLPPAGFMMDFAGTMNGPHWLGAYIPPDSLVPISRPEFAFLAAEANAEGYARIKAKKLRGVQSFGLLVPAPQGSKVGDNVTELLGVKHYEPQAAGEAGKKNNFAVGGEVAPGPNVKTVKYDLDAFRRYHGTLKAGEPVVITEKLDGSNARYVYLDGVMHCGSRTEWKREYPTYEHLTVESLVAKGCDAAKAASVVENIKGKPVKKNLWWVALEQCPSLRAFCEANPGVVVYGEVFGRQGKLRYTDDPNVVFFAAFDIMKDGNWMNPLEARKLASGIPWAPLLFSNRAFADCTQEEAEVMSCTHPYEFDAVCAMADGPSLWEGASCIREGVVVTPLHERYDHAVGRVKLKAVSAAYLER